MQASHFIWNIKATKLKSMLTLQRLQSQSKWRASRHCILEFDHIQMKVEFSFAFFNSPLSECQILKLFYAASSLSEKCLNWAKIKARICELSIQWLIFSITKLWQISHNYCIFQDEIR